MTRATEQIACPHYPEHGLATKRWLPPDERQMITKVPGDVFEIDCPYCGKTEMAADQLSEQTPAN
jgi:hypothetical protein